MATPRSSHAKDENSIFTARDEDMIFKSKEKSWYFINIFIIKFYKWSLPALQNWNVLERTFSAEDIHRNALISGHPGEIDPGEPLGICTRPCKFHLPRAIYFFTKSYHCPSPREHNLKGLPNCNIFSCIIFNKSLTIIYTVNKNSLSTCFLHKARFSFIPRKS